MIMMQHVQDPPPSVLATRPDLPPAVDGVITRALAKVPAERFETAGELFAALSTAAGGDVVAAPRSLETVVSVPVSPAADDLDEETVVRPRETPQYAPPSAAAPDAMASFSPWRIIVPSAIVLVVVFGIVFLLTRSAGQTPTNKPTAGQTELAADPNSQPVQPASPPNGASEHGIQPLSVASPAVSNLNANANQGSQLPPDLLGNFGANANANDNTSGRSNKNANQPRESPTPKSVPTARTETPSPKPSPSTAVSKPTATPPGERR
jgi:hypothetical protein